MSPLLWLFGLYLYDKSKGGGAAVTSMTAGKTYTLTVLFTHPNEPPAAQLKADLESTLSTPYFTVDATKTVIKQNTDGTWSGQATGLYKGGGAGFDPGGRWTLLQMAAV